ncbi:hypothetical protein CONPUDRAFT_146190 [Coniophora puteana RWD-64-598 SS2]|uniref:Uncharacterized protein n=1 Tax=Coniophora puteana (strain RWD-64-598) TaxID=741705 RepID=A0A5M3MDP1_CONPW|nr:uncharacterized protein CONPUDRAFT_146190 [Coniophora puteana RWD-64-598 SS2]EIW77106.1 hypothetical protein CONPUDRAFT_146190 [Coniophora puteana RWD-64-598 SS2]
MPATTILDSHQTVTSLKSIELILDNNNKGDIPSRYQFRNLTFSNLTWTYQQNQCGTPVYQCENVLGQTGLPENPTLQSLDGMLTEIPQELLILIVEHTGIFTALALRNAGHVPLPRSLENLEQLTSEKVEAITCRAASLCDTWENHAVGTKSVWRLDLPRSVTWLRLVEARWLLVASSDTVCSSLDLYDLAALENNGLVPLIGCYLPGPILSGEAEIQDGRLVPILRVLALCKVDGGQIFSEVRSLVGYSDIMLLHNDFVVCGTKDNMAIPHIVYWKTGAFYAVEDVLDEKGTRFKACIWDSLIVTVGAVNIKIYSLPSPQAPSCKIQTLSLSTFMCSEVEEVSFFKGAHTVNPPSLCSDRMVTPSELSWIKPFYPTDDYPREPKDGGIWKCTLRHSLNPDASELYSISDPDRVSSSLAMSLTTGSSGCHVLWVDDPYRSKISLCKHAQAPYIEQADLAALPQLAFDYTLGIIAVGNLAGEIAVIDLVGSPLASLFECDPMPLSPLSGVQRLASTMYIPLDVIPSIWNRPTGMNAFDYEQRLLPARILDLSSSQIPALPEHWRDRESLRFRSHLCEDTPFKDDLAFKLPHSYEFLGRVQLILDGVMSHTLLSKGGLYFIYTGPGEEEFIVFRGGTTLSDILNCIRDFPEAGLRFPWLHHETTVFLSVAAEEKGGCMQVATRAERSKLEKNRFHDMRARGGHPPMWLTNGKW